MITTRIGSLLLAGLVPVLGATAVARASTAQTAPPTPTRRTDVSPRSGEPSRDVRAYTLPPERYEQAVAYSRAKYRLHFAAVAWQVLVLAGLLVLRVAPRIRTLAERASGKRFGQALVFVPVLLTILQLASIPVDAFRHRLALFYGQSVQGWPSWLWDWAKGLLVTLVLATPLALLLYDVLRKKPRRWWLVFWAVSLPFVVFVVFVSPYVIDPLFFDFGPLAERAPRLASSIEKVTARGGLEIPRDRMFVMDASRKLKSVNAYVTGFGASKRVVVWDTTLAEMTEPQTLFVLGHEMGHYVLGHVVRTILFVELLLLVLLFTADRLARLFFAGGREPFGIRGLADWASLPALLLVLAVATELSLPVVNGYSRAQEHSADVYSLEVIHGVVPDANRAAAEAFQALGEINLADPHPSEFVRFWLYSHPPIAERIRFARTYDPWSSGRPRFVPERGAQ